MARAFVFGDDIDTDVLAPGHLMKLAPEALAKHCLEAVDPSFATTVRPGDVVVAGRNFGLGSSREQAAVSLKLLGVSAVLALSFARIFYRNAINLGLPVFVLSEAREIDAGDELTIDAARGVVENLTTASRYAIAPMPTHLMQMLADGGLIAHLRQRFAQDDKTHGDRA